MATFIGVDPHKRLHAACAVDDQGRVLARVTVDNTNDGFAELRAFGRRWRARTWAIEGCNGVGKHLSQRLVAAQERVVDVSTRRAALVRVYAGGNGRKNDDTDAHSIAMVAVHTPDLPVVEVDSRHAALRLLSHRRSELVAGRTQCACRLHRDLVVLLPGGASKKLTVARAKKLLATVKPRDEVGRLRRRLVADQIRDLAAFDKKIATIDAEIAALVEDTDTTLRDMHGVGSTTAATIVGEVGDVSRFRDRNHFASYNGTAPADRGSAGNPAPAVNLRGNRRLNHVMHIIAITQIRHDTNGRALYLRKIAEGKTPKEARRVVKRRVSDAVYRTLVNDAGLVAGPGGHWGTTLQSSVTDPTPTVGSSDKPQPGPDPDTTTPLAASA